jgi:hypothetical protein
MYACHELKYPPKHPYLLLNTPILFKKVHGLIITYVHSLFEKNYMSYALGPCANTPLRHHTPSCFPYSSFCPREPPPDAHANSLFPFHAHLTLYSHLTCILPRPFDLTHYPIFHVNAHVIVLAVPITNVPSLFSPHMCHPYSWVNSTPNSPMPPPYLPTFCLPYLLSTMC